MTSTRYRPLRGTRAAIVGGHPAAVAAGARILDRGGNAIDAAIATAAAMTVALPHMCGPGGDGFILVYDARTRRVHALNAGGPAPSAASPDRFPGRIPDGGTLGATVPGIVDGWAEAVGRFGTMAFADVLAPAVALAERGVPMYDSLAAWLRHYESKYLADTDCRRVFFPHGRALQTGEVLVQNDLARSLAGLGARGARDLYEGELAQRWVEHMQRTGGLATAADLAAYHASWGEPVTTSYRGTIVHTQPPMSQGWMLLQMLAVLDGLDVRSTGPDSGARLATLVALVRSAFEDRHRVFGDPRFVPFKLDDVLGSRRIAEIRRGLAHATPGAFPRLAVGPGDTTTLSVVDGEGNAVSMIQSLWVDGGVMIPGTGMLVNARLNSANVTPGHPDCVAGGKTPVYTMHTYMATRADGQLTIVGGTPGGNSQIQTNIQVLTNIIDFGLNAQEAIESPRFVVGTSLHYESRDVVSLERRLPAPTREALSASGLQVQVVEDWGELTLEGAMPVSFGSAKAITIDPATGVRTTGIDPRRDGHAYVS